MSGKVIRREDCSRQLLSVSALLTSVEHTSGLPGASPRVVKWLDAGEGLNLLVDKLSCEQP